MTAAQPIELVPRWSREWGIFAHTLVVSHGLQGADSGRPNTPFFPAEFDSEWTLRAKISLGFALWVSWMAPEYRTQKLGGGTAAAARNTVLETTFEVGRRFRCTMRVDCSR